MSSSLGKHGIHIRLIRMSGFIVHLGKPMRVGKKCSNLQLVFKLLVRGDSGEHSATLPPTLGSCGCRQKTVKRMKSEQWKQGWSPCTRRQDWSGRGCEVPSTAERGAAKDTTAVLALRRQKRKFQVRGSNAQHFPSRLYPESFTRPPPPSQSYPGRYNTLTMHLV